MMIVEELAFRAGPLALSARLTVGPHERLAVLGPSGSGKTSLLRAIAGLIPAVSGRLILQGRELTGLAPESRGVGLVFQDQALFPALTPLENVAFGLRARGVGRVARESRARDWLRSVGLQGRELSAVHELSGGERQRLALARALICEPEALLLDEPFSALDASARAQLRRLLLELHAERPRPWILVTHDEADVEALATDRIRVREENDGQLRRFER